MTLYRRLQRFFQHERFDQDLVAWLLVKLLNYARPKRLALDRTNWKFGGRDINVLVLALVTRRFRVPLMWVQLGKAGNSSTRERIVLMRRYLDRFGASSISMLLADREFIGAEWLELLCKNNVPFAIRLPARLMVHAGGGAYTLSTLLRRRRGGTWAGRLEGMKTDLQFGVKRLRGGEMLIVATNAQDPRKALREYRKRWGIECLFGDCKTRGLNLEDTHITDPRKLDTLMSIIALAVVWAYRCATVAKGRQAIPRKTHGRRAKSWFRVGLDTLRRWLMFDPQKAIQAWCNAMPSKAR